MYPINTYHPTAPTMEHNQPPPPYDSFDKHLYSIDLPNSCPGNSIDGSGPSTSGFQQFQSLQHGVGGVAYYNHGMVNLPTPIIVPPPVTTVIPMMGQPHRPIGPMMSPNMNNRSIAVPMVNAQNQQVLAVIPRYGGTIQFMTPEAYRKRSFIIFSIFAIFIIIVGLSFFLLMTNNTGPTVMAPVIFGEFLGFIIIAGMISYCYKSSTDPNNPTK